MAEVTNDLMYELLKKLNQRFDKFDHAMTELRNDNMSLRNQLHIMQGDINSLHSKIGHMELRLDRIESRLELRELSEARRGFDHAK